MRKCLKYLASFFQALPEFIIEKKRRATDTFKAIGILLIPMIIYIERSYHEA